MWSESSPAWSTPWKDRRHPAQEMHERGFSRVSHWGEAVLRKGVRLLIRAYQLFVSPVLPTACMYSPSCSRYAAEAYERHGFWRATRLTLTRLLRCWPWATGGDDPVP